MYRRGVLNIIANYSRLLQTTAGYCRPPKNIAAYTMPSQSTEEISQTTAYNPIIPHATVYYINLQYTNADCRYYCSQPQTTADNCTPLQSTTYYRSYYYRIQQIAKEYRSRPSSIAYYCIISQRTADYPIIPQTTLHYFNLPLTNTDYRRLP